MNDTLNNSSDKNNENLELRIEFERLKQEQRHYCTSIKCRDDEILQLKAENQSAVLQWNEQVSALKTEAEKLTTERDNAREENKWAQDGLDGCRAQLAEAEKQRDAFKENAEHNFKAGELLTQSANRNFARAEAAEQLAALREKALADAQRRADIAESQVRTLREALASEYIHVAPVVAGCPVELWEHMGDGYCRGKWAEDGSPYGFRVPEQLVPAFFALQRLARLCKNQHQALAATAPNVKEDKR